MGGTLNNVYNNVNFALNLHFEAMARLQEQMATGSRVNRPSDDPFVAYQVLGLNSQERLLENYIDNLSGVMDTLGICYSVIQGDNGIISSLTKAKTSVSQVMSGSYGENERGIIAEGIDEILEQVVMLANTKHSSQYIFGGSDTDSAPYAVERTDGKITSVTYQGSSAARNIEVADGVEAAAFMVGDDIFSSDNRSDPVLIGNTGAAAGSGTSSIRGYTRLEITQPGGPGTDYRLSIDDDPTSFVDVTVPPGSANTMVTNVDTGKVLYVNTTGITTTGVELVSVAGTHDVFNTLITIRDIFENAQGLSEDQLAVLRDNSLEALDEIIALLVRAEVSIGSKIGFLDNLRQNLEDISFSTEEETTRLEEADIAQVAIDLSRREVLYQMSLAVAGKIMSMSLLDFIR